MKTAEVGASLLQSFAEAPDPRVARSLYAIAQCGRLQSAETARALGFTCGKTPTVLVLHKIFKVLDVVAFEAALMHWPPAVLAPTSRAIALNGKALHGIHGEELPRARLVLSRQRDFDGASQVERGGGGAPGGTCGGSDRRRPRWCW